MKNNKDNQQENKEVEFVKLTNDSLFKVTFGRIDNRKFLEDLLECYYGYPKGYLHNRLKVSYESIQDKATFKEMNTRNDIVVQFDNTYTNLEMYTTFNEEAYDKSTFYVMRISTNQLLIGDTYKQLQKVTQINFIESDKINISEDFRSIKTIGSKIEQEFIKLDMIPKETYNEDRFYKYLRMFNADNYEELEKIAKGDEILMEIVDWVKAYQGNDDPKFFNDEYWNERIYRLEGKKDGIKEEKLKIARNMLAKDMKLSDIAEITGLSLEQINKLKEENKG